MNKYLSIDIGGTYTKYALMNEECAFLEKGKVPTQVHNEKDLVNMILKLHDLHQDVNGIAISCAGVIDSKQGYMYNAGSLEGIVNFPLADTLEERIHKPVTIENDARSAGLAELWQGSLQGCDNAVAMIIGTAVGGAIMIDGKVLTGSKLMAGELSYIMTDVHDAYNGANTFAQSGGVPYLIKQVKDRLHQELSGEEIFALVRQGNQEAIDAVSDYAHQLAVQITNLYYILNPEKIAIGGGISQEPLFLEAIEKELDVLNKVYPFVVPKPEITHCTFYNDANLIGALYKHLTKEA